MLFSEFHRRFWIPLFGGTVIGGMGIHNWDFLKPHYPDVLITGKLSVKKIQMRPEHKAAAITWEYLFFDENNELMQSAGFTVLHSTGGFIWINKSES